MVNTSLNIVVIGENPIRAAILEEGLREAGYTHIGHIAGITNLLDRIYAIDPDVIIIDLENPRRDVLEQMFQVSRTVRRPVAMFVDQSDGVAIQAAVDAGVSAYIVDGLKKERVRPILDMTISRFRALSRLEGELAAAREALEARKVIERAKGILMKQRHMGEEEAYALLRRTAMNQKRKLLDIAQRASLPRPRSSARTKGTPGDEHNGEGDDAFFGERAFDARRIGGHLACF